MTTFMRESSSRLWEGHTYIYIYRNMKYLLLLEGRGTDGAHDFRGKTNNVKTSLFGSISLLCHSSSLYSPLDTTKYCISS